MAPTTRRSRKPASGFRPMCSRCTEDVVVGCLCALCQLFASCLGEKQLAGPKGLICCQALSDTSEPQLCFLFTGCNTFSAAVCIHLRALLCLPLVRHQLRPRRTRGRRFFWNAAKFLSRRRKPPDLVSLFGFLRHGKSASTVCVVLFYGF